MSSEYSYANLVFLAFLSAANVITGLISMAIMNSKGRSGLLGFLLGFFFSIAGIIVCAILPEDALHLHRRMARLIPPAVPRPAPVCPRCRQPLTARVRFCPSCGAQLTP